MISVDSPSQLVTGAASKIAPNVASNVNSPKMAPAAISALSQLAGVVIQGVMNHVAQNRQNAYNSPVAQMARLRQAGLNPYAFSNSIASNNTQARPTEQPNAQSAIDNLFSNINQIVAAKQGQMNLAKTASEIKEIDSRTQGNVLNNMFTDKTMTDRIQAITLSNTKTHLYNLLQQGKITFQTYHNISEALNTQFNMQLMNPDLMKTMYEKFQLGTFDGMSPRMFQYLASSADTRMKWDDWHRYWYQHGLREGIAQRYESSHNMPWSSNDKWMKLFRLGESAIEALTGKQVPELLQDIVDKSKGYDPASNFWSWSSRNTRKRKYKRNYTFTQRQFLGSSNYPPDPNFIWNP